MKDEDQVTYSIGNKFIIVLKTQIRMPTENLTDFRLRMVEALNLSQSDLVVINLEIDEEFDIYKFNEFAKNIKKL